jgi:hypothetical protein
VRAYVRLRDPRDNLHELEPGDVIGRSWKAALWLQDPRISECHAMVSLRSGVLKLLALRGRFSVDEKPQTELELAVGQKVRLAGDIVLDVVELALPDALFAIEGDGLPRQIIQGVATLRAAPRPELLPGFVPDGDAVIWSDGLGWNLRLGDQDRPLVAGDTFSIGTREFRAVEIATAAADQPTTQLLGTIDTGLTLFVRYDTVHIHRLGELSLALDGLPARILSELAVIRVPIGWEPLARDVWPDEPDTLALRRRWDTALARLRRKLRDARIRPDLVRSDGCGNFEIFLTERDRVEDQT